MGCHLNTCGIMSSSSTSGKETVSLLSRLMTLCGTCTNDYEGLGRSVKNCSGLVVGNGRKNDYRPIESCSLIVSLEFVPTPLYSILAIVQGIQVGSASFP